MEEGLLFIHEVNEILAEDNSSIRFEKSVSDHVSISIVPINEIPEADNETEHPNIRKLVTRMDILLEQNDYPGVLHASATIFETLAKTVVSSSSIQNQSLVIFFGTFSWAWQYISANNYKRGSYNTS